MNKVIDVHLLSSEYIAHDILLLPSRRHHDAVKPLQHVVHTREGVEPISHEIRVNIPGVLIVWYVIIHPRDGEDEQVFFELFSIITGLSRNERYTRRAEASRKRSRHGHDAHAEYPEQQRCEQQDHYDDNGIMYDLFASSVSETRRVAQRNVPHTGQKRESLGRRHRGRWYRRLRVG